MKDTCGESVSYDTAHDEVVANAMSKMFDDGKLVEKLAKLKEQDKDLAQKLWEGFKKILSKFIGIYQKESALFKDAADLMEMKETFEQLQNMFAEALVEASENYQTTNDESYGEQYSSQETDYNRDFDYSELNWATDLGIITGKDRAIFERTINNEIYRGAKPQTANGEYIIDTGKCLMFTDGDFHNPTLSRVIVFATEYESLLDEAKRRIFYDARSTGDVQESKQVIEDIYGPGFAVEYTQTVYGTDARQNRGRKRANGKGSDRRYHAKSLKERLAEEGLTHLLEDDGEVYSTQETDVDSENHPYSYEGLPSDAFYANAAIYNFDFLVSQKPMRVIEDVPPLSAVQTDGKIDYEKTVKLGLENVEKNGGIKRGAVYLLENGYTKRPLQISKNSIEHGLGAKSPYAKRTNARLGTVIGEICKNAIPINGVVNTHNVRGTYVMAAVVDTTIGNENKYIVALVTVEQQNGMIQSIEHLDVTHALSGRKLNDQAIEKENRVAQGPRAGTKSDSESQFSTISIRDFLGIVNSTHQGYLSDDVIKKLNVERRGSKKGLFSEHETDAYSNRDLLANALESVTQSSIEYQMIQEYKGRIRLINEYEEKLAKLNAEIRQIRFGTKGKQDTERLKQLETEARTVAVNINRNDRKLLSLEASEPLRKVIAQERKKEAQRVKKHVKEIQENKKLRTEHALPVSLEKVGTQCYYKRANLLCKGERYEEHSEQSRIYLRHGWCHLSRKQDPGGCNGIC